MFTDLVDHYGYLMIFSSLLLELIAFPLPGEVIMSYSGFLVFQGRLGWLPCILAAGTGTSGGMTVAYGIGRFLGAPFFQKYGHYVHLGPARLKTAADWYEKYGKKLLLVAYYIPGLRHLTGYFSGITRLPFHEFAGYAYTGAFIWAAVFVSMGKVLGSQWEELHRTVHNYLVLGGVIAAGLAVMVIYYQTRRRRVRGW